MEFTTFVSKAKTASNISGATDAQSGRFPGHHGLPNQNHRCKLQPDVEKYLLSRLRQQYPAQNVKLQSQHELKQTSASLGSKIISSKYDPNHRQRRRYQEPCSSQKGFCHSLNLHIAWAEVTSNYKQYTPLEAFVSKTPKKINSKSSTRHHSSLSNEFPKSGIFWTR